jgi:hypothetical protein
MAVKYVIVDSVVVIVMDGVVTDRELLDQQAALFADPAFVGDNPRLVDASAVTEMRFSADIVRHVAKNARERGLRRAALVASKSEAVFGLMRMYAEYTGDATVEVFRDRESALAWLKGATSGWDVQS